MTRRGDGATPVVAIVGLGLIGGSLACDLTRAGWRVIWGARVLSVVGVSDGGAPRIVLVCEEEKL